MKTIKLLSVLTPILFASTLHAQAVVGFNMVAPPMWGPAEFTVARYYYLPAVEAYYDLDNSLFIYSSRGVWVRKKHLPLRYRKYNLYLGYKVVMHDYLGEAPYIYFNDIRKKYNRNFQGLPQQTNGERPGRRNNKSKLQDS